MLLSGNQPAAQLTASAETGIIGAEDRVLVSRDQVKTDPYRRVGMLYSSKIVCTAALISDFHVLTAAYCVTDSAGNFHSDFRFEAGKDTNAYRYYGAAQGTRVRYLSGYVTGGPVNDNYNMALVTLDRNLGDFTGHFGYGYNPDSWYTNRNGESIGYPANVPHGGPPNTMVRQTGNPTSYGITTHELRTDTMDITVGQGGGPVHFNNSIHGVASRARVVANGTQFNAFTRMTQDKFNTIKGWIADDSLNKVPTDKADLISWDKWFFTGLDNASDYTIVPNQQVSLNAYVRNNGTAAAGSFTVRFRLSTDTDYDTADTFLGDATVSSLAAFDWKTATKSVSIPAGTKFGDYYIVYSIDALNTVSEFTNSESTNQNEGAIATPITYFDPNDQIGENNLQIVRGATSRTGATINVQDVDFYYLDGYAGQKITIQANTPNSNFDPLLRLFNSAGDLLVGNDDFNGRDSQITFRLPADGRYYAAVSAYQNSTYDPLTGSGDTSSSAANYGAYEIVFVDEKGLYQGTSGDDIFVVIVTPAQFEVTVNGVSRTVPRTAGVTDSLILDGLGGNDQLTVYGSVDHETATFEVASLLMTGAEYTLEASNIETNVVNAGLGNDLANLYDSAGNDTFSSKPTYSTLSGQGFHNRANGFDKVTAYATAGDAGGVGDRAYLYDSMANDSFYGRETYSYLSGNGFKNYANGFDKVYAYATAGDAGGVGDRAHLYDSAGNDWFYGRATHSYLYGSGFYNYAKGFDKVHGYATAGDAGGVGDRAYLYDSSGNDTFYGRRANSYLTGPGYYNYAAGFDKVSAYATAGANDRAFLYDSSHNDTFYGRKANSYLTGPDYYNYAQGFDKVSAFATTGANDLAYMYDSSGNDTFTGRKTYSTLVGSGFSNYANGFDKVYAYATTGANDRAYLYDTSGNDTFTGRKANSHLTGKGYYNHAAGFDKVYAYATAGGSADRAYLYDTSGDDTFYGRKASSYLTGVGYYNYAQGFDKVFAYATGGVNDRAYLYDSSGNDTFYGRKASSYLTGAGFYNFAQGFDNVFAYATAGDAGGVGDRAYVYDLATNDLFYGRGNYGRLTGSGYLIYANGFDRINAYATAGGTDTINNRSLAYDFFKYGTWENIL